MSVSLTQIQNANVASLCNNNGTALQGIATSSNGTTIYVSLYPSGTSLGGVIKSTNSGVSFSTISYLTSSNVTSVSSVACSSDGSVVYACQLGTALYKSTDSGSTWSVIQSNQSLPNTYPGGNPEVSAGYSFANVYKISCDSTGSILLMTTNYAATVYRSADGGTTWTDVYVFPNYKTNANSPSPVSLNTNGSILYAACSNTATDTDYYIYKSTNNGSTWSVMNALGALTTSPFSSISTNLTGDFVYVISAPGGQNQLNIIYETHSVNAAFAGSGYIYIAVSSYNNGNNIAMTDNGTYPGTTDSACSRTYSVTNIYPPGVIPGTPCFKEDTNILCFQDGEEIYRKVQDIRKGDLVKTLKNGYLSVDMIGNKKMYNSGEKLRSKEKLFKCTSEHYPELTEDLIITGGHAILVDELSEEQKEKTIDLLGQLYVTDGKYRLLSCFDEKAQPYEVEGIYTIYHFALENDNYYMNYGVYANGLLVESTSKRYLLELSEMTLIE
jgi:hypothetical protein